MRHHRADTSASGLVALLLALAIVAFGPPCRADADDLARHRAAMKSWTRQHPFDEPPIERYYGDGKPRRPIPRLSKMRPAEFEVNGMHVQGDMQEVWGGK